MPKPNQTEKETKPRRPANRGRLPDGMPNPVDVYVGSRVRLRRTLMGMSQEKLGEAIGLTFQQVQKYERGANRIGASRLWDLSRVLDVPVSFFYDAMSEEAQGPAPVIHGRPEYGIQDPGATYDNDPMGRRETLELVRAYYAIPDVQVRRRVYELAKALAGTMEEKK